MDDGRVTLEQNIRYVISKAIGPNEDVVLPDVGAENVRRSLLVNRCRNLRIVLPPKINNVSLESCADITLVCHSVVTGVELTRCVKTEVQLLGRVPTLALDLSEHVTIRIADAARHTSLVTSSVSGITLTAIDSSWSTTIPDVFRVALHSNGRSLTVTPCPLDYGIIPRASVVAAAMVLASAITHERLGANSPVQFADSFVLCEIIALLAAESALERPDPDTMRLRAQQPPFTKVTPVREGNTIIVSDAVFVPRTREIPVLIDAKPGDRVVIRKCACIEFVIQGPVQSIVMEGCSRVALTASSVTGGAIVTACKDVGLQLNSVPPRAVISVAYSTSVQLALPPGAEVVTKQAETVNWVGNSLPGGELAVPNQFRTDVAKDEHGKWATSTAVLRRP